MKFTGRVKSSKAQFKYIVATKGKQAPCHGCRGTLKSQVLTSKFNQTIFYYRDFKVIMLSRSNNAKTPKKHGGNNPNPNPNSNLTSLETNCYEGKHLTNLLQSILRGVESARHLDGSSLPEKIWIKQQFAIGVNDVTRVLERMKPCAEFERSAQLLPSITSNHKTPSVKLQAVLVASDCSSRWLTKHLQSLASSRSVPLIFVKDNKEGSLRLGELVKLKTAIAIGIKVKGNAINKIVEDIIQANECRLRPDGSNSAGIFDDFQHADKQGNLVTNII